MSYPLAIFAPRVGAVSETFIRRHIDSLLPGGTVAFTRALKPDWSVNVPILELDRLRPRLSQRGIDAVTHKLGWSRANRSFAAVKHFVIAHRVEVILGEYLDASIEWLELARELGIRFYAHAHGYDVSLRLQDPSWRKTYLNYNNADGVITVSRYSRDKLIELGLNPAKVHVVPCGVDVPEKPPKRSQFDTIRCLMVGRMVGKKSPIFALDAFRRASEAVDVRLDFVGVGALLPAAQQFIECFNLESKVTLHGSQPNETVLRMMRETDIFMQHSVTDPTDGNQEGLPVAILEAMAQGLPVVSTRHAGIPEAVQDGVSGFLVDEGDSEGMANHIVELARNNELRNTMGQAGWRRATDCFSGRMEQAKLRDVLGLVG